MIIIPDFMTYLYCAIIAISATAALITESERWIIPIPSAFTAMLMLISDLPFYLSATAFFAISGALLVFHYAVSAIIRRKL